MILLDFLHALLDSAGAFQIVRILQKRIQILHYFGPQIKIMVAVIVFILAFVFYTLDLR